MRRPIALTATAVVLTGSAALGAATSASGVSAPTLQLKTVGYIYAGTVADGIETLAVRSDDTLSLVHTTPSPGGPPPYGDIGGVTLVHTKSGPKLYVLAGRPGYQASIYTYSVSATTGALTKSTVKPPAGSATIGPPGNDLLSWDGRAHSPGDADAVYAEACVGSGCTTGTYGLGVYKVNQSTGALTLVGFPHAANIMNMAGADDRIDLLESSSLGRSINSFRINHSTGIPMVGGDPSGYLVTNDHPPVPSGASAIAPGVGTVGAGGVNFGGTTTIPQIAVYYGSLSNTLHGNGTNELVRPLAMKFLPHVLVVGGNNGIGPKLQFVTPDGQLTEGTVDLTTAPYNLNSGNATDPYSVETIFTLGHGLYFGNYFNPIVQGTWGVGGKNLELNQTHPTVAGTFDVTSMAGFLLPTTTKTTVAVHRQGNKLIVSGGVVGGVVGIHTPVELMVKKGTHYVPDAKRSPALTSTHHFKATFTSPNAAKCEISVRYPGTATTKPSHATTRFGCK
jgi:hypothetical protein